MIKYYDWDDHCWLSKEEYEKVRITHTISRYNDENAEIDE
jgi:hypothetical protein